MLLSLRTPPRRLFAASKTSRRMGLGLALAASAVLLQLTGCANMGKVGADVSSYGQWPAERSTHQKYVFERLPSQQAQADFQSRVEAAAAPMLARKGFVKVASADQADVLIQVASQSRLYEDPYRFRNDGRFFGTFGFGGLWGGRGGGIGLGMSMEPAQTQMQVDVLIRDRRTNQTLYETHAVHERYGSASESTMPYLFEAALLDFPAPAISPRRVLIDATPAPAAASQPAAAKP